jgi:hypothetical protein
MTSLVGPFFTFVFACGTVYDLKLSLEHLDTRSYGYKHEKSGKKTVKNVLKVKWLPFQGQILTHGLI